MIETRLLYYFLAVAKEQSFTKAAEALGVSQPNLSKQLIELEKQLDTQLFLRSPKGLTLTKEGIYLQNRAAEILSLLEQIEATFQAGENLEGGEIHIGCGDIFLPDFVVRAFRRMQEKYPLVQLHVYNESGAALAEIMDKGLLDMALLFTPTINTAYVHHPMPVRTRWGLLIPADSPMARKKAVTAEDIKSVPLIYPFQVFHSHYQPSGFSLNTEELTISAVYTHFEEAARLAAQGIGYAYTMEDTFQPERYPGLVFRPMEPELFTTLYLVVKKDQNFSPAARIFLDRLLAEN